MAAPIRQPEGATTRTERRSGALPRSLFETDRAIVLGLRAGQSAAGAALYDRHHVQVRRVLVRVLGPDSEVRDLLQDVFVAAIDGIDRLADPDAMRAWLTGIAVYTARAEIRRRGRARWFPLFAGDELPDVPAPSVSAETTEAVRTTYHVLGKLPADERIALSLRFIEGMELVEVAEACDVSLATIKRTLARAQKKFGSIARTYPGLRDALEEGGRWK